jgi:8-oxo-dGTP diphosphatase
MTSAAASPEVYVDTVIFQLIDNELTVLLTQRSREPFKGRWVLPGGFNPSGLTTYQAMEKALQEKTSFKISQLGFIEQLYTFDTINPEGYAISVVYLGLAKNLTPKASRGARNHQFFPIGQVPDLGFDHNHILKYAHERLCSKLSYTNAVFALLPVLFTLSHLQTVYETVLGQKLDKRNFRKKFLSLGLVTATNEFHREGAHRPAKLYKFNSQALEYLQRGFDTTS